MNRWRHKRMPDRCCDCYVFDVFDEEFRGGWSNAMYHTASDVLHIHHNTRRRLHNTNTDRTTYGRRQWHCCRDIMSFIFGRNLLTLPHIHNNDNDWRKRHLFQLLVYRIVYTFQIGTETRRLFLFSFNKFIQCNTGYTRQNVINSCINCNRGRTAYWYVNRQTFIQLNDTFVWFISYQLRT